MVSKPHTRPSRLRGYAVIAPGVLVAATGVGAGDLLTASLGGSALGVALLWAAVAGAFLKWFLNEGLARWQMATGTTLLEGWITRLGAWVQWVFMIYFLAWSFFTGGALVNACGVAGTAFWSPAKDPATSKMIWGVVHSIVGLTLVWFGGFKFFARLMGLCVGLMFVTVILTAILMKPDWSAVAGGLLIPTIPAGGLPWVLGVLGGVGGTVTLMSYGYWIREAGRSGSEGVKACRFDLAIGYTMTALFGVAMIFIGSRVQLEKGDGGLALLAVDLADQLAGTIGPVGKWVFLLGFWGAVFSSLLGVWQSVPYLFADFLFIRRKLPAAERRAIDFTKTRPYRAYLLAIAIVPLPALAMSVKTAQLIYAIMGSLFMPFLAITLLIMNNRTDWVTRRYRSGLITNAVLVCTVLFFAYVALSSGMAKLSSLFG